MSPRPRGAFRPGCANRFAQRRGRRERRVLAAPAVSRAKVHKKVRTRAYRYSRSIPASLRNGFTAYAVLSPATNSSCHRRRRINGLAEPGWANKNLRRLDTSNGCQDHTVSPYAAIRLRLKAQPGQARLDLKAPQDIGAVRLARDGRSRETRPAISFAPDAAASTASHPNVRDDGRRPSSGIRRRELCR
jgi:hypothetical protein